MHVEPLGDHLEFAECVVILVSALHPAHFEAMPCLYYRVQRLCLLPAVLVKPELRFHIFKRRAPLRARRIAEHIGWNVAKLSKMRIGHAAPVPAETMRAKSCHLRYRAVHLLLFCQRMLPRVAVTGVPTSLSSVPSSRRCMNV